MTQFMAFYRNVDPQKARQDTAYFAADNGLDAVVQALNIQIEKGYGPMISVEPCTVLEPGTAEHAQWSNTLGD